ncbi:MAG: hypothetical protein K2V38_16525, partial [Gemmataceae bacterium]|nr:hypothetical protein [Gemmataceae bacterium]
VEKLLGYKRDGISAAVREAGQTDAPPGLFVLQQKEAVIHELAAAAAERLELIRRLDAELRAAARTAEQNEGVIRSLERDLTAARAAIRSLERDLTAARAA